MPSSRIIDVALGLALVFGVTAALSSMITELVTRFLGLRGKFLLGGLRELLDGGGDQVTDLSQGRADYDALKDIIAGPRAGPPAGVPADVGGGSEVSPAASGPAGQTLTLPSPAPDKGDGASSSASVLSATGALLGSPLLRNQGITGQMSDRSLMVKPGTRVGTPSSVSSSTGTPARRALRSLPPYIPARSFAEAVVDVLVPDATGATSMGTIRESVDALPDSMSTFKTSLQALVKGVGGDTELFRTSLEHWYDNHMARVAGWYKRRVAVITLVVGAVLVVVANINAVTIARTLYTDDDVRTAVSAVAAQSTACPSGQNQQTCLQNLGTQLAAAASAGMPIGWETVPECAPATSGCNWWDQRGIFDHRGGSGWRVGLLVIGFVLTIIALVPGAQFWFDLLSKLGSLRSTGPKPPGAAS